jgi:hypothetical protein
LVAALRSVLLLSVIATTVTKKVVSFVRFSCTASTARGSQILDDLGRVVAPQALEVFAEFLGDCTAAGASHVMVSTTR